MGANKLNVCSDIQYFCNNGLLQIFENKLYFIWTEIQIRPAYQLQFYWNLLASTKSDKINASSEEGKKNDDSQRILVLNNKYGYVAATPANTHCETNRPRIVEANTACTWIAHYGVLAFHIQNGWEDYNSEAFALQSFYGRERISF